MAPAPRGKPAPARSETTSSTAWSGTAEAPRQLRQLGPERRRGHTLGARARQHHHVCPRRKLMAEVPTSFPENPLDAIPDHGVADLAGHSDTKPRPRRQTRRPEFVPLEDEELEQLPRDAPAPPLDAQELPALADAAGARKPKADRHAAPALSSPGSPKPRVRPRTAYFLAMVPVSCLRPLRRRRRSL